MSINNYCFSNGKNIDVILEHKEALELTRGEQLTRFVLKNNFEKNTKLLDASIESCQKNVKRLEKISFCNKCKKNKEGELDYFLLGMAQGVFSELYDQIEKIQKFRNKDENYREYIGSEIVDSWKRRILEVVNQINEICYGVDTDFINTLKIPVFISKN